MNDFHYVALTCRGVILEKLIVTQPAEKFLAFYGTRSFITVFTEAYHWSRPWAWWICSTISHPVYLIYILILYPHCYVFQVVSFLQLFRSN